MKCQTVRCEILQSAFISAGGSLSSAGAQLVLQDWKERREEERMWKHPWPLKAFWSGPLHEHASDVVGATPHAVQTFTTRQCKCVHYLRKTKTQKSLSEKSNRRERESRYQQDSAEERQTELIYFFGLFTLHDCLASPNWNLPPRRIAINHDVSPPRVPTKEPRLSANLRRPGQFACLTLCNRLQSCPQKTVCLTKTCQMKRQAMHFEVAECFHGWWVIEQWWGGHDPGR